MIMDGKCDVPGCSAPARHYGMDKQGLVFEMCEADFRIYFGFVETGKMPEPKLKCARCGEEVVLKVHQFDALAKLMDNRKGKRKKDPAFLCTKGSCRTKTGSWAIASYGVVDFDFTQEEKKEAQDEIVKKEEGVVMPNGC